MTDYEHIYDFHADRYDQLVAREDYQGNLLPALQRIRPLAGLDVVELGAGTGRLTRLLAPHVRSILACDRARPMLDVAVQHLQAAGWSNWGAALADNRRLPLRDRVADLSVAGWSFGHATVWHTAAWQREIAQAVGQMLRVLRPGGTAVILETLGTGCETPRPPSAELAAYYTLLEQDFGFTRTWVRTDYRFCSPAEAEQLTRFFFGDELAVRVAGEGLTVLPECTGIWWRARSVEVPCRQS